MIPIASTAPDHRNWSVVHASPSSAFCVSICNFVPVKLQVNCAPSFAQSFETRLTISTGSEPNLQRLRQHFVLLLLAVT